MKTRVLLVNFTERDKEEISKLGVEADLGYLSDAFDLVNADSKKDSGASFYSPLAVYEYKAIFIKLTDSPPLESEFKVKAKIISEKDSINFLRYWYENKGLLTLFAEASNFSSLEILGIPHANLVDSSGNDKTISFNLDTNEIQLRKALEETESFVTIPPLKYIEVKQRESRSSTSKNWTIFTAYINRNDEKVGIYLNWGYSFEDHDNPAFLILPEFKNYPKVVTRLLKTFAQIYPKFIPEIVESNWATSDKFYPKEVLAIDETIKQKVTETKKQVDELKQEKLKIKEKFSFLHDLLTESGEKLKEAVLKTLNEVFELKAADMDKNKKTEFREDVLIQEASLPAILTEVKGTKSSYPSFTYITQVFKNLLKGRGSYPNAIGGLILNHDLSRNPDERAKAFTNPDEDKELKEIVYIDTRVLHELAIAVIDYGMSTSEAKKILLQKGRVEFNLNKFIKEVKDKK